MFPAIPSEMFVADVALPPVVVTIVPLTEGRVRMVVPATAGACSATVPDVSPAMIKELMVYPFTK